MRKLKSEGEMFVVGVTNFWVVARCGQLPHESFYKVLKSTYFLKVETVFAHIAHKSAGEASVEH